jgi:hypothetical protein
MMEGALKPPKKPDIPLKYAEGKSAETIALNVGVAATPDAGPANTVFAFCVFNEKDSTGVVVGVATDVVNSGERLPEEKEVTNAVGDSHAVNPEPIFVRTCPAVPAVSGNTRDQS